MSKFLSGIVHGSKKAFVVVIHVAIAIGLTDLLAVLLHNPSLQKYWPVLNVIQVIVVKGIEYYNAHKYDLDY